MRWRSIRPGDWVVYRKWKQTTCPGSRAQQIRPAPRGDHYLYCVEKVWRVLEVVAGDRVLVETRRGKKHVVNADDPNLRPLTLLDRIRHRSRLSQPHCDQEVRDRSARAGGEYRSAKPA